MHGRVKVKTSEEQQEEKRKERQKKLQLFQSGIKKAFEKRNAAEFDNEALGVSGQLLQANPDVYTLWNFRKEIYLYMMENRTTDELQELANNELLLTEQCLRTNPKSYGAWHHRSWVMLKMPKPDWDLELRLCGKFLELDERNFHCWDYRRFVCANSKVEPSEELEFSLKKIEANFSNYSSWHYRSSLLPLVHPGSSYFHSVAEDKIMEEYDLVRNAVFTDPGDQSAWFYHRWLLGRETKQQSIVFSCVCKECSLLAAVLSKPVNVTRKEWKDEERTLRQDDFIRIRVNGTATEGKLRTRTSGPENQYCIWVYDLPQDQGEILKVDVSLTDDEGKEWSVSVPCMDSDKPICTWGQLDRSQFFRADLRAAPMSVLENELQSCQELQELEPDNKWVILTSIFLMRAIGKPEYESAVLDHLESLSNIDPTRRTYYADLRSKFILEDEICRMNGQETEISLASKNLTALYHMEYFMFLKTIDLSKNYIKSSFKLYLLIFVRELLLDENEISDCSGIRDLPRLELLSLKNNNLCTIKSFDGLQNCPKLSQLYISGNPVCLQEEYKVMIKSVLPNIALLG